VAPFVSYAQNWEDVRLRRLFADRPTGFYVDVGAAHPQLHSFTHTLYRQGWRGINVEPLPSFFALLADERPEDRCLNAVLGRETGGTVTFFEAPEQRGSSSMRPDVAQQLRDAGLEVREHTVPVRTLADVLEEAAPATFDLLKVDVEGAEDEVLAGNDWTRFRPRLVVVERTAPERWEQDLLDRGYLRAADDGINTWYVEQDDAAWIEVLAPPVSVLDDFVPFEALGTGIVPEPAAAAPPAADGQGPDRPPPTDERRRTGMAGRPRTLLVLSSSNQLYSGTGRVLFEIFGRLGHELDMEVAIDDDDARNVDLARRFCEFRHLTLHVGRAERVRGAPDAGNAELADVVRSERWDVVVAVSWANAATNGRLLELLPDRTALGYLPLHQPLWTIPLDAEGQSVVGRVQRDVLRRADTVLCLSPWEQDALTDLVRPAVPRTAVVPPGADFELLRAGAERREPELLFVGDFREPRKRFDRVVAVLAELHRRGSDARLLVVGNESDRAVAAVPPHLAGHVRSLGYVDEERLAAAYREAAVLLLLSEFEAFGLPVVEALASATPVVMSRQPAPESLFTGLEGMTFVDGDDVAATADAVQRVLAGDPVHARLAAARDALAGRFGWDAAAWSTRNHLRAAWAARARATAGFLA
jgi:FkbM family methyltransferase